ncbi:MAG TPA: flagellar biosynthetic protein FliO [Acidimicrobiales bacterium]|nr:flagellar biosynthetic protein FliO [Acidimicrobiales bacterium]
MAEDVNTVEVMLRLGASLAVVVALVLAAAWVFRKQGGLRVLGGMGRGTSQTKVQVVDRAGIAKGASVALVTVGGRALLIGVTEHSVSLLTEAPELVTRLELEAAERDAPADVVEVDMTSPLADLDGPRRPARMGLMEALRETTVRRS